MARRFKLLTGLSSIALAGAVSLAACGGEEGASEGEGEQGAHAGAHQEGGEGASEGEGAVVAEGSRADVIAALIMIEGHLRAGASLYERGDAAMAATHMKHPQDEIFSNIAGALKPADRTAIETALQRLGAAVAGGESADAVNARFGETRAAIGKAIDDLDATAAETLLAMVGVLNAAGAEYENAVKDGVVVNAHEYQDAHGFMASALERLGLIDGDTDAEKDAVELAREQMFSAFAAAPSTTPPAAVAVDAAMIYGAAARIEIAALGL